MKKMDESQYTRIKKRQTVFLMLSVLCFCPSFFAFWFLGVYAPEQGVFSLFQVIGIIVICGGMGAVGLIVLGVSIGLWLGRRWGESPSFK